ncbi:MAG: response regulator [Alphaproteobacteria bacterium]|nr:response regulator [Alphaproteobacteria bacterium]
MWLSALRGFGGAASRQRIAVSGTASDRRGLGGLPIVPRAILWVLGTVAAMAVALFAIFYVIDGDVGSGAWIAEGALVVVSLVAVMLVGYAYGQRQVHGTQMALLRAALDAVRHPEVVTDHAGAPVLMNLAFETLVAGAPVASVPRALRALVRDARDVDRQLDHLVGQFRAGAAVSVEVPLGDASGGWSDISVRPLATHPGLLLWSIEDVTQRRVMLDVIKGEQRRLADYLENMPLGFYSVDQEGRFLFANRTLAAWLNCEPADLAAGDLRLHAFVKAGPGGLGPPHSPFGRATSEIRGEVTLRTTDGRTFQTSITQTVEREPSGTLRTRSVVRDLSADRFWEQALRASERRLQRFFQDSPIGVAILDEQRVIKEANPTFARLIDRDRDAFLDRSFDSLLGPRQRAEIRERLDRLVAGEDVAMPIEVTLLGQRERVCALYAVYIEEDTPSLLLHLIDTTQRRILEIQFTQSQKMLAVGQLAGGIAHDFNNLLTAMIGFCDLLLLRHKPGDQSFPDIVHVKQNANRAANLVRQLLAFSRQQTMQPHVLSLTEVLADLSSLLRRLIGASIELNVVHDRELGPVKVDQVQLEQVIINLAVNARDAMPEGGTLTIRTANVEAREPRPRGREPMPPGDYVLIEVTDTGTGIPPDVVDRIFEPFFSTKEVGSGTGLGLSTVYGIVKQTGGYIFVDTSIGRGSTFSIFLPRHAGTAEDANGQGAVGVAQLGDLTGVGTVLLVEDEDPVRLFSARALRNKGYKVYEARNGEAALDMLAAIDEPLDLMITDIVMPRMDGPTLIGRIRALKPEIRVICISGYAEESFRRKLDGLAAVHFLSKPFSLQQLAAKVKEVITQPRG